MKTKIKSGKKIKVIVLLIIFVVIPALLYVGMFVPFYKDIPDDYKSSFHSYDEALAYARTMDPEAEVEKEHKDTIGNVREYTRSKRVWHARINGTECEIMSLAKSFSGDVLIHTILTLDSWFPKDYYCMRTNYFDSEIPDIVRKYPELGELDTVGNGIVSSEIEYDEMTTDKFKEIWNAYTNVLDEIHRYNPYVQFTVSCDKKDDDNYVNEYYIFEPTENEYKSVYNNIVIDNVLKNHSYRDGTAPRDDPEDIWASKDFFTDPSDENAITSEKLKALWEEYKVVYAELHKESPYIKSHKLQIRLNEKKGTYSTVVGYYEFTDTDEKTYERVCREMEKYLG